MGTLECPQHNDLSTRPISSVLTIHICDIMYTIWWWHTYICMYTQRSICDWWNLWLPRRDKWSIPSIMFIGLMLELRSKYKQLNIWPYMYTLHGRFNYHMSIIWVNLTHASYKDLRTANKQVHSYAKTCSSLHIFLEDNLRDRACYVNHPCTSIHKTHI